MDRQAEDNGGSVARLEITERTGPRLLAIHGSATGFRKSATLTGRRVTSRVPDVRFLRVTSWTLFRTRSAAMPNNDSVRSTSYSSERFAHPFFLPAPPKDRDKFQGFNQ